MREVAHHLQNEAVKLVKANNDLADLFARSVFNRYYYSTYHIVRDLLGQLEPQWRRVAHKNLPQLMTGQVVTVLKAGKTKASRVDDSDLVRNIARAIASAHELSSILTISYAARVTADYEVEQKVAFDASSRFALDTTSINDAHQWPHKAEFHAKDVLSAWHQLQT
jgi:uncharacterized protein (UPF0332 family)